MREKRSIPALIRFIAKVRVDEVTGCWNWSGEKDKDGYGFHAASTTPGDNERSHRWSYEYFVAPIRYEIDHQCNNPGCVNPLHLRDIPHRDNILRSAKAPPAIHARMALCKRGHPFATKTHGDGRLPSRYCPTCMDEHRRARKIVLRTPDGSPRLTAPYRNDKRCHSCPSPAARFLLSPSGKRKGGMFFCEEHAAPFVVEGS